MSLEPLTGLRVVDLYAGSGALGIEALSRGAAWVDFVERDRAARDALRENLATLGLEAFARVWPLPIPAGIERLTASLEQADLILADPPYGGDAARALLEALGSMPGLRAGARVVLEHHQKDPVPERHGLIHRFRERRYGETCISTYRVAAATPEPEEG